MKAKVFHCFYYLFLNELFQYTNCGLLQSNHDFQQLHLYMKSSMTQWKEFMVGKSLWSSEK